MRSFRRNIELAKTINKQSEKEPFWKKNIIAFFALIISIGSLSFNVISYNNSHKENLKVSVSMVYDNYETSLHSIGGSYPSILDTYWEVILTNNGDKPLSIVDYDIQQVSQHIDLKISDYSYLNGGVFSSPGQAFNLPIQLESGSSIKFYLKVGVLVSKKSSQLIMEQYQKNMRILFIDLTNYLAKNKIDLFGNKVDPILDGDTVIGSSTPMDNRKEQFFSLSVKTSKNNYFRDAFFFYKGKEF